MRSNTVPANTPDTCETASLIIKVAFKCHEHMWRRVPMPVWQTLHSVWLHVSLVGFMNAMFTTSCHKQKELGVAAICLLACGC